MTMDFLQKCEAVWQKMNNVNENWSLSKCRDWVEDFKFGVKILVSLC